MTDVQINGDAIRLGQFLKLADVVQAGAEVKELLADDVAALMDHLGIARWKAVVGGSMGGQVLRVTRAAV